MRTQAVFQGVPLSGASTQRPFNAHDGHVFYDHTIREPIVFDSELGFYLPVRPSALWSTSSPRYIADDFKGAALDSRWDTAIGNDAQAVAAAHAANQPAGLAVLTSGNAGTGIAADGSALAGPLVFEAEEGKITLTIKAKVDAITSLWYFIGFSDVLPSTTLEEPVSLSGTTFTTNATDACGFMFDTAATTDTIRCVGVKNDVDGTHLNSGLAPVADTYRVYKIVIDTDGDATFYIDGTEIGTVEDAVSPGVDLCPILAVNARTTASRVLTADYVLAK